MEGITDAGDDHNYLAAKKSPRYGGIMGEMAKPGHYEFALIDWRTISRE